MKQQNNNEPYQFPIYTSTQLKDFEMELNRYKKTVNIQGKDYTFYDEEKYMKEHGALNDYGAVIYDSYPPNYAIERNKLEQLYKLQGKREYAIKMNPPNLTPEKKTIVDSFMTIAQQTPDIYDIPQDMLEFHGLDKEDGSIF